MTDVFRRWTWSETELWWWRFIQERSQLEATSEIKQLVLFYKRLRQVTLKEILLTAKVR